MQTIQQLLKNTAVNGVISLEKATAALQGLDKERAATVELLKALEKQVGMTDGEKINTHLAAMTGQYFNPVDYHYEKPVGEQ